MVFGRIGVLARTGKMSVQSSVHELVALLLRHNHQVILDEESAALVPTACSRCQVVARDAMAQACDLVIVVGGDGSILQAASLVLTAGVPILGINRGRLGFLADISPEAMDKVLEVLSGDYLLDERVMLSMQLWQDGVLVHEEVALNDIVLHAGKSVHTIDYQLSIDDLAVYRHHADGLIVSTPTGSTAYNLSAGGPIIHPALAAICLTPMYPHTLSSRPILVADTSCMDIKVHKDNRTQPMVSSDGRTSVPVHPEQTLRITKHSHRLKLLHPKGYDFYEACRTKLHWSLYSEEFAAF